jgi:hypothetical protein
MFSASIDILNLEPTISRFQAAEQGRRPHGAAAAWRGKELRDGHPGIDIVRFRPGKRVSKAN